jgi:transcriptional regulator with XRE-family HTH domain
MAGDLPFADLLRHHRLAAELTQEALAEKAGLSLRGVSDLERGLRRAPQRDTLLRLLDALHLGKGDRDAFQHAARRR